MKWIELIWVTQYQYDRPRDQAYQRTGIVDMNLGHILQNRNTWTAVGAYHSETPKLRDAYAAQVSAAVMSWGKDG